MHSGPGAAKLRAMDNRTYSLTGEIAALDGHALSAFERLAAEPDTPLRAVVLRRRDDGWSYELCSGWTSARDDATNIAWTRAAVAEVLERPLRAA